MFVLFRFAALGALLAVAACTPHEDYRYTHVPSAARGGVTIMGNQDDQTEQDERAARALIRHPAQITQAAPVAEAVPAPAPGATTVPTQQAAAEPAAETAAPVKTRKHRQAQTPAPEADAAMAVAPSAAVAAAPVAQPAAQPVPAPVSGEYILGIGDELRMTVYGEDDLSGQYIVGSTGVVALPLVGNVPAAGKSIAQFEAAVAAKLAQGYLKDPRVSVQVANYRPFFILGEVAKPGSYPYVNGMSVINAVALAGGYTYRADSGDIRVRHASAADKSEKDTDEDGAVAPGDIIRVTERFF